MRLFHWALVAVFAGTFGLLASCDYHGDKPSDPPPKPPSTYGESCPKVAPAPISVAGPVATPAERATCEAAGGSVERQGLIGSEGCVQPYCDAGQACSDSSECIGRCYGTDAANASGEPAVGACQPNSSPFGCRTEIVAGAVGPTLCID